MYKAILLIRSSFISTSMRRLLYITLHYTELKLGCHIIRLRRTNCTDVCECETYSSFASIQKILIIIAREMKLFKVSLNIVKLFKRNETGIC